MPELESKFQVIVSKRAAQQLVEHAVFMARLEERLARQLAADFWKAADSLQSFPYRNPILRSSVFVTEKYRKMVFGKWYLLIYQIKGERVFVEYVIDGRQDYQWLIQSDERRQKCLRSFYSAYSYSHYMDLMRLSAREVWEHLR